MLWPSANCAKVKSFFEWKSKNGDKKKRNENIINEVIESTICLAE